jgi:hypothetical protein
MRRCFGTAPPGLSPRIAALIRRADRPAGEAAAPSCVDAGDAAAASAPAAPAAARAALVARNSAALAELRGMLGGSAERRARPEGGAAAAEARAGNDNDDDDNSALLRDVRGITTRARRGDQVRPARDVACCAGLRLPRLPKGAGLRCRRATQRRRALWPPTRRL